MSTNFTHKPPAKTPTMESNYQSQPILVDETSTRIHRQPNNSPPPITTDHQLVPATQSNLNNVLIKNSSNSASNGDGNDDIIEQEELSYSYNFPPGYRFAPKDEELAIDYLQKKVLNQRLVYIEKIPEVNLYEFHPKELSEKYDEIGDKEWYFFTPRARKYPNGKRPKRAAGNGYWKATGADKKVYYKNQHVGYKKALVYYQGKPPKGENTRWVMQEFRLIQDAPRQKKNAEDMTLDDWVLCRIYHKEEKSGKDSEEAKENSADDTNPVPEPEEYSAANMDLSDIIRNLPEMNFQPNMALSANNVESCGLIPNSQNAGYPISVPGMIAGNFSMPSLYFRRNTLNFQPTCLLPLYGPPGIRPNKSCPPGFMGSPRPDPIQAFQPGSLPYKGQVNFHPPSYNHEPLFAPSVPEPEEFSAENMALSSIPGNISEPDNNIIQDSSLVPYPQTGYPDSSPEMIAGNYSMPSYLRHNTENFQPMRLHPPTSPARPTPTCSPGCTHCYQHVPRPSPNQAFQSSSLPYNGPNMGQVNFTLASYNSYESSDQVDYQGGQEGYSPDGN